VGAGLKSLTAHPEAFVSAPKDVTEISQPAPGTSVANHRGVCRLGIIWVVLFPFHWNFKVRQLVPAITAITTGVTLIALTLVRLQRHPAQTDSTGFALRAEQSENTYTVLGSVSTTISAG
jgi:hypothetical protein